MRVGLVFVGLLAGFGAVIVAVTVVQTWLHIRLKTHHIEIWHSLGDPMPIVNLGAHNQGLTLRFLRLREYEQIADPLTRRVAAAACLLHRVFFVYCFGAAAIVFGIIYFVE